MKVISMLSAVMLVLLTGCASQSKANPSEPLPQKTASSAQALPLPMQALIKEILAEQPTNPPSSILRYRIDANVYFYRPSYCCDFPSVLYNEQGVRICEPDGGFTGRGDGRCEWFRAHKKDGVTVWRDKRGDSLKGTK